jgi:uncharacterized protein YjbI with pentapeptide repeats
MPKDQKLQELLAQLRTTERNSAAQAMNELRQGSYLYSGAMLGADLRGSDLRDADLRLAKLQQANLEGADLRGADLHGADLREVNLNGANINGARLSRVDLTKAKIRGSVIINTNFQDSELKETDFYSSELSMCDLTACKLIAASLREVRLQKVNLSRANLNQANLTDATMIVGSLAEAKLVGADLTRATFRRTVLKRTNLSEAYCVGTIFSNVDLSDAIGLETVIHHGQSTIGIDTLYRSMGKISEVFLRGCGVPEAIVRLSTSLLNQPVSVYAVPQIFISYSRKDWSDYVQQLVSYLSSLGFSTWIDQHLLRGGDDWLDKINEALEASEYMILCLSPEALESKYVKLEYRYFFNNNKPIIPVVCSSVSKLPAELNGIQHIPYGNWDALVQTLNNLTEPPPTPKL